MPRPVHILGLGADGLTGLAPAAREAITSADFLAGGRRHLEMAGPTRAETMAITADIDALAARLRRRGQEESCVVLASGDPMLFGIGATLADRLGREEIRVEPAVSSMQLAFARAGLAWHDAALATVHGRDLATTLRPLLGRPRIGLFTQDGASPAAIAEYFLERGLVDYDGHVGENLGRHDERWTSAPLAEFRDRTFAALNVMLLSRAPGRATAAHRGALDGPRGLSGIPDHLFDRPATGPTLLTHADVRAVTLSRFRDVHLSPGPIWDIGAGLGGVSVELARAFPSVEVLSIERSESCLPFLRSNRRKFAAWNMQILAGEAPDCLPDAGPVGAVFLGGTGGRLDEVLDTVLARLSPRGRLVANFVTLENLTRTLDHLRNAGWRADVTQVQISHGEPLAGLTSFVPLRPVWIVSADRILADSGEGLGHGR